jgi:beta-lactam-binding protein with PASTA domain
MRGPLPTSTPLPPSIATPEPGANVVTVPSVVGLSEEQARLRIEASGLSNTYSNYQGEGDVPPQVLQSVPSGYVLSQNPSPGARVTRGTTVYLAVRKR